MMSYSNLEVINRSVEAAKTLLDNPVLAEQLGDRRIELAEMLGRIVPIEDNARPGQTEELENPDVIPMAVVGSSGITTRIGNGQPTTTQRKNSLESIMQWGLDQDSAEAEVNSLLTNMPANKTADISYTLQGGNAGNCEGIAMALPVPDISDVPNPPEGRVLRFTLRPSIFFSRRSDEVDIIDADVILHELTHVKQKENRPITLFSSQKEANNLALRDELEAYHVGSLARRCMEGVGLEDANHVNDPNLQIAVEKIRVKHNAELEDPFEPSEALFKDLEKHGYTKDRMLGSRFDFIGVIKQFKKLNPEMRRAKKNRKRK